MEHPHNLRWFELLREEIYEFIQELAESMGYGKRNILAKAPVKAGKKEIVENISLMFSAYKTYYVTSLNRKDVVRQKDELEQYDVTTCLVNSDSTGDETIAQIRRSIAIGKKVIICWDECDYGSGIRQKMAKVLKEFVDNLSVVNIYFSATPEETEASALVDRPDYEYLEFTPPREYVDAKWFLDNNLVRTPMPFFEMDGANIVVSSHGLAVVSDSITPKRNILVTRVVGGKKTEVKLDLIRNAAVKERLERQLNKESTDGKTWKVKVIDYHDSFDWEDHATRRGYIGDEHINYLFVIAQTCNRGTDLKGWHPYIAAWHDPRSKKASNLNTLVQAFLRPCHYSTMPGYDGPQAIALYVDIDVIRYVAGEIDLAEYKARGGKAPTRTKWRPTGPKFEHDVRHFNTFDEANDYVMRPDKPYPRGPQIPPSIDDFEKNAEGFHIIGQYGVTSAERQVGVWEFNDAFRVAPLKYNRRSHYKYVPCYRDTTDPNSLVWLLTREVGIIGRNPNSPIPPPLVTKGSM